MGQDNDNVVAALSQDHFCEAQARVRQGLARDGSVQTGVSLQKIQINLPKGDLLFLE